MSLLNFAEYFLFIISSLSSQHDNNAAEGVNIPDDISIIGTDGIDMCKDSIVPLTTVNQPKYEQDQESAKLLFSIIEGGKGSDIILEPNLEIRKSTSKPSE